MKFLLLPLYLIFYIAGGITIEVTEAITAPAYFALYGMLGLGGWICLCVAVHKT